MALWPPSQSPPRNVSKIRDISTLITPTYSAKIMIQHTITISNKLGLHARASVKLTQTASQFQSEVWISKASKRVNAKSIMGVMMLAAGLGQTVVLEADGIDEVQAIEMMVQLIDNKFGEGE
jgi:phosphocarrier protein HPr